MPQRIQRRRTRGWRMPPNAVIVSRPTKWGNPFSLMHYGRERAMELYRRHAERELASDPHWLDALRGKDLVCWCKEGDACHADILLELANQEQQNDGSDSTKHP